MPRQTGSRALVTAVILAGLGACLPASGALAADECLAAPNAKPPKGSHWYYRLDRATQRKCWYMRAQNPAAPQAAAQPLPDAIAAAAPLPAEVSNYAVDATAPPPEPAPPIEQRAAKPKAPAGSAPPAAQKAAADSAAPDAGAEREPAAQPPASVWPDPTPQIQSLRGAEPSPRAAQADAVPAPALSNTGSQPTGEAAGAGGFLAVTPLGIVLIGALGLAMAGLLTRAVVRLAMVRRRRVYVEPEPEWIDDLAPEEPMPPQRPGPRFDEVEVALRDLLRSYDRKTAHDRRATAYDRSATA